LVLYLADSQKTALAFHTDDKGRFVLLAHRQITLPVPKLLTQIGCQASLFQAAAIGNVTAGVSLAMPTSISSSPSPSQALTRIASLAIYPLVDRFVADAIALQFLSYSVAT
jgi:hypothetical protein